jgi:radical SAM protein with 4Fe4S-binding SPASM domain
MLSEKGLAMTEPFVSFKAVQEFPLWGKIENKRFPISFDLEITARCNNNCRHCFINLPAGDEQAKHQELSPEEIEDLADQAVSLGALSCLITGGEPLLRGDFADIYLKLKRKGLLLSVFTNASLITKEHIKLFKQYPPRDLEVTVYGITKETHTAVTRNPATYSAFMKGLNLLFESNIKVRLKAMALRSNLHEFSKISSFCEEKTKDFYRFDPFLHLRYDRDETRNAEIRSERLTPEEVTTLERADRKRFESLTKRCDKLDAANVHHYDCNHLFHCAAGKWSFNISYNGLFRACGSLWHPECLYDLRKGTLKEAWEQFIPQIREKRSDNKGFKNSCQHCPIVNLCMWCPAHAYLETGLLDQHVDSFCRIAHARTSALGKDIPLPFGEKKR